MSKKQWAEEDRVEGGAPCNPHADAMTQGTDCELGVGHTEVGSVLTKFPGLKSEIEAVFCSAELGIEWLTSPIPALGGSTPIEVIQKGDLNLVLMTLNKIKYGDYS